MQFDVPDAHGLAGRQRMIRRLGVVATVVTIVSVDVVVVVVCFVVVVVVVDLVVVAVVTFLHGVGVVVAVSVCLCRLSAHHNTFIDRASGLWTFEPQHRASGLWTCEPHTETDRQTDNPSQLLPRLS